MGDYATEFILYCFQAFWKTGTLAHLIIHHLQTSILIHSKIFYHILRCFQDNVGTDKFAAIWGLQAISSCWFYRKLFTLSAQTERGEKLCNFMELPLIWSLLAERASSLSAIASPCCCHSSHCLGSHSWPGQHPCCCCWHRASGIWLGRRLAQGHPSDTVLAPRAASSSRSAPSMRKPRSAPCRDLAGLVALSPGTWPAPRLLRWLQLCLEHRHRCSAHKWGNMNSVPGTAFPVLNSQNPAAGIVKLRGFLG